MAKGNIVYTTYFDRGFLLKGLALHESLIRHTPKAKFWILALDKYTEKLLKRMKLRGVTVVALEDFEDRQLLAVKSLRHPVEYYWTCTPSWMLYVLKKSKAKCAVYLDADLYFYSNADRGVEEIGDKSLLTVEHRFPKGREILVKDSGRFNVAFNVFKNDKVGLACLNRWRGQCLDWCYWKHEDGKLGDQMYLDEWPKLYGKDLVISKNLGVDTAPWNVGQYKVTNKDGETYINKDMLICYHFHQFQIIGPKHFSRTLGYTLSRDVIKNIYEPFEKELTNQYEKIKKYDKNFKIKETEKDKVMLFRQRMARYFGPVYWRLKSLILWQKS